MLNYKHLYYFWVVAHEGSIKKACDRLHLTPQTISGQLTRLEQDLEISLFNKAGRNLVLTLQGKEVLGYADDIFRLGNELTDRLRSLPDDQPVEFRVGVLDAVPKSIAYRILAPAMHSASNMKIICQEGDLEELLLGLAVHKLDLVLTDAPMPSRVKVQGFNHLLGRCGISFFATDAIAQNLQQAFPHSLDDCPLLIPGRNAAIRQPLEQWLEDNKIKPRIVGEFDDTALMKAFGRGGVGVFTAPTPIASEVEHEYGVTEIGRTDQVIETFYAITVERKIAHPAVLAITREAKELLV